MPVLPQEELRGVLTGRSSSCLWTAQCHESTDGGRKGGGGERGNKFWH